MFKSLQVCRLSTVDIITSSILCRTALARAHSPPKNVSTLFLVCIERCRRAAFCAIENSLWSPSTALSHVTLFADVEYATYLPSHSVPLCANVSSCSVLCCSLRPNANQHLLGSSLRTTMARRIGKIAYGTQQLSNVHGNVQQSCTENISMKIFRQRLVNSVQQMNVLRTPQCF